jgi:DNA adenine methylase
MNEVHGNQLAKPFLRWAGGKTWLIDHVNRIIEGRDFVNYHEPFLGGGSVFFNVKGVFGASSSYYLSDVNEELINTYIEVRDNCHEVISFLERYSNDQESYYKIRETNYDNPTEMAARFIYLNGTSFNGIYRVNKKGIYNVPYGFRKTPFYTHSSLLQASVALQGTIIKAADFGESLDAIKQGDFVFLDPPYTTSHNKNGFIKYNKNLFSLNDQERLNNYIHEIKKKKAYYIMTNAANIAIDQIFGDDDEKILVQRYSVIGGKHARRGPVDEYLFTNIRRMQ